MGARTRTTPEPLPSHTPARTTPEPHPSHLRTHCEPCAIDRPMIDRPTERPIGRPAGRAIGGAPGLVDRSVGRRSLGRSVGRSTGRSVRRGTRLVPKHTHRCNNMVSCGETSTKYLARFSTVGPSHLLPVLCPPEHAGCRKTNPKSCLRPVPVFLPNSPKQTSPARTLCHTPDRADDGQCGSITRPKVAKGAILRRATSTTVSGGLARSKPRPR